MDRPDRTEPRSPRQVEDGGVEERRSREVRRSNPSLPETVSVDFRPFIIRKPESIQSNSNTATPFSASPARSTFREVPSLTAPERRSASVPYSASSPSIRSSPQPPPMTGPSIRPKTATGELAWPERPSSTEGSSLERPERVTPSVSSVSSPTDRPAPFLQEKSLPGRSETSEPYRVGGVNRGVPSLPFQVSKPVARPDVPSTGPVPSSQGNRTRPETVERSVPSRTEVSRPEAPPFVSAFPEGRPETSSVSRPDGSRDLRRESQRLTEPTPKDYNPKNIRIPKKSLRLSDL